MTVMSVRTVGTGTSGAVGAESVGTHSRSESTATVLTHLLHTDKAFLLCLDPLAILLFSENLAELLVFLQTGFLVCFTELFHLLLCKRGEFATHTGHIPLELGTGSGAAGATRTKTGAHTGTETTPPEKERVGLHLLEFFEIEFINLLVLFVGKGQQTVHLICNHMSPLLYRHLLGLGTLHLVKGSSIGPLGRLRKIILCQECHGSGSEGQDQK